MSQIRNAELFWQEFSCLRSLETVSITLGAVAAHTASMPRASTHFNNLLTPTCLNMCNKRHKAGSIFASHSPRWTSPAAYKLSKFKPFLYTLSILSHYFGIEAKTSVCSSRFSSACSSSLKSHKAPQNPAGLYSVYDFNGEKRAESMKIKKYKKTCKTNGKWTRKIDWNVIKYCWMVPR